MAGDMEAKFDQDSFRVVFDLIDTAIRAHQKRIENLKGMMWAVLTLVGLLSLVVLTAYLFGETDMEGFAVVGQKLSVVTIVLLSAFVLAIMMYLYVFLPGIQASEAVIEQIRTLYGYGSIFKRVTAGTVIKDLVKDTAGGILEGRLESSGFGFLVPLIEPILNTKNNKTEMKQDYGTPEVLAQINDAMEAGVLNTVTIESFKAIEDSVSTLRAFSGTTQYRLMDETDVENILSELIVQNMVAARLLTPTQRSRLTSECTDSCDERIEVVRKRALNQDGKAPGVDRLSNADVTAAWEQCPNSMAELCREGDIPASAMCMLRCSDSAKLADQKIYNLDNQAPSADELRLGNWIAMPESHSEADCMKVFAETDEYQAAFWTRAQAPPATVTAPASSATGSASASSATGAASAAASVCYFYSETVASNRRNKFQRSDGATGALLLKHGSSVALPDADAVIVGQQIAAKLTALYGAFDVDEHADEVYRLIQEADEAFETHKTWYRDCFTAVATNVTKPPVEQQSPLVLDIGAAGDRLKSTSARDFNAKFVWPLSKMLAALQIAAERDVMDHDVDMKARRWRRACDVSVIYACALACMLIIIVYLQRVEYFHKRNPTESGGGRAPLTGSQAMGMMLQVRVTDNRTSTTFKQQLQALDNSDFWPNLITMCSGVMLFWVMIYYVSSRNYKKTVHNFETKITNTKKLRDETRALVMFLYSLSGTTPGFTFDDGTAEGRRELVLLKKAMHFDRKEYIKEFKDPNANMFDLTSDGVRTELYRRAKSVVEMYDRCNTAAGRTHVPFPFADVLVYTLCIAFLIIAGRFLYQRVDVSGVVDKLAAVRRLMPEARLDPGHTGAAGTVRSIVMCEDQGLKSAFDMFKWAMMCASVVMVTILMATLTNSDAAYESALNYIKLKSECAV